MRTKNLNNPYWFDQKPGEIVTMSDGTQYRVTQEGWRRIKRSIKAKKPVK